MTLYQYLDHLPAVPDHLTACYHAGTDLNRLGDQVQNLYQPGPGQAHHLRFRPSAALDQWLNENLQPWRGETSVAWTYSPDPECYPVEHRLHRDTKREWVLMYLLHAGGNEVTTTFYQHADQTLEMRIGPRPDIDVAAVSVLDHVVIACQRWCLVNAMVIHGVTGITQPRISLQIGLLDSEVNL